MRLDDAVAFEIQRHSADGHPITRVARPASRVEFARPAVQRVSGRQNRMIVAGMALLLSVEVERAWHNERRMFRPGFIAALGAPLVNCSGAGIKLQRMELNCSRRENGGSRCVVKA